MYSANSWSGHFNSTVRLALPVCLSNVGHIAVDLADNFFIGQLEEKTMGQAAITLAGIFYILVLVFAIGISYGLTPIVAEAHAQNRKDRIVLHLRHAFVQNIAIASLLFLVLFVCSPLLKHTGRPEEVTDLAIRFLNVMMLSMLPLSIFFTCKQFAEGMSDTKAAMVITIGANAMNIFLNWVLVFGHLGIEGMGVIGSCWATFISRCLMAAAMLGYILLNKKYHAFRPAFNFRKLLRAPVIEQLRIGIPSGLMFVMEVAAFGVPVLFIPGTDQLAAHRISIGLAAMTYMISSGLGAAATVRVGNHLGLRDRAGTRRAGFSAIFLALIFMAIAAVVFIVFRHNLTSVFNDDPGVLKYAIPLLLIAAAFQLFDGMQVTAQGALRGLKDTMIPGFIAFIAYWLIGLPASWYFCVQLDLGVEGVWYG
ncbi:MAG TPA: MATE family efflux transporter, partial [Bacteroidia bacterium]|nr:MATE family efflux transporter [Bacteroidia bacterium]